jgi:hypothetical protein
LSTDRSKRRFNNKSAKLNDKWDLKYQKFINNDMPDFLNINSRKTSLSHI